MYLDILKRVILNVSNTSILVGSNGYRNFEISNNERHLKEGVVVDNAPPLQGIPKLRVELPIKLDIDKP
jgi:hypothetical protein